VKRLFSIVLALITGLTVLAGYYFQAQMSPVLSLIMEWGIVLAGTAGLIGVGYLLRMHINKLINHKEGVFYSVVVLVVFFATLVTGIVFSPQNSFFTNLILNVQVPVEAGLLAVLAVTLLVASLRLIRVRGWTPLSIGFLSSAVITLVLNLGYLQTDSSPLAADLTAFIRRLPVVGARGILIGMALGGLIVGLRVLLTIDRPYGEG